MKKYTLALFAVGALVFVMGNTRAFALPAVAGCEGCPDNTTACTRYICTPSNTGRLTVGPTGMTIGDRLDPITARQRWDTGLKYAFGDTNLAAAADWRRLGYDSQSKMISDFENTKKIVYQRQNFLTSFFRYPTMDLARVDFISMGFNSAAELQGWINSISDTAFKTYQ